ncbi:MAG: dephospho-CoA kinase [Nanoarchaeota archaeon]
MKLGITGIFGSGKTTVAKHIAKKGYKHINADQIGHKLLDKTKIKSKIIKQFGKQLLTNNKIDRRKLKNIVFYNNKELIKLNRIIHPYIIKEIKKQITKKCIIDAALLIETKATRLVDKLIVIKITKKELLRRLEKKNKYNKTEINNILRSQLSQREKLKKADIIIDNSKDINYTKKQVSKIR